MSNIRIVCLSRAVSPITHMAGTTGNESLISREPVRLPDGTERKVPVLSGNMLRHVSIRSPGMHWLIAEYGLPGTLTLAQLNFLFHGGSLTDSTGREDTARIVEMGAAWPILRLLGGCLPNQILQGAMLVSPGLLCCEENRSRLESVLGRESLAGLPALLPAEQFVKKYQYVTFDAPGKEQELASQAVGGSNVKDDPRMLYVGQCVQPGAYFAHDYILKNPSLIEVGCVLWSIQLWQQGGGVVGGMGAKGHGKLSSSVLVDGCDRSPGELVGMYLSHALAVKERAVAWLTAAFAPPKEKKTKEKKLKKTEPVTESQEELV